jgi:hypothetical protein
MYALALGVARVSQTLPLPVYTLLSGLNASTVGVIAFAAVQLSTKAITDKLSRLVVVMSACAGLCYNALWYFPVLILLGGVTTMLWDMSLRGAVGRFNARMHRRTLSTSDQDRPQSVTASNILMVRPELDREPESGQGNTEEIAPEVKVISDNARPSERIISAPVGRTRGPGVRASIMIIIAFFGIMRSSVILHLVFTFPRSGLHCDHGGGWSHPLSTSGAASI